MSPVLGELGTTVCLHFFGIEAPQRAADVRLAVAEEKKKAKAEPSRAAGGKSKKMSKSGGNTGALEKKKR